MEVNLGIRSRSVKFKIKLPESFLSSNEASSSDEDDIGITYRVLVVLAVHPNSAK